MNLFVNGKLAKLLSLKLQQANSERLVYEILRNCPNLEKLEIREPSITDQQLGQIDAQLSESAKRQPFKLHELTLPSSVRNKGLFAALGLFRGLRSLSISNFEPLFDYLDETADDPNPETRRLTDQLKRQLEQLNRLTITCPVGRLRSSRSPVDLN